MRQISFALTTEQIRTQTKTVTRRLGWTNLTPGTLLQPIVKGQGIPKGGQVEKIGAPIRVVNVRREPLAAILENADDCRKEGFPDFLPGDFCAMFCDHHPVSVYDLVTRIEFEYTEPLERELVGTEASEALMSAFTRFIERRFEVRQ